MTFTITNQLTSKSFTVQGAAYHTLDYVWMSQRYFLSTGVYYTITDENGNSKTFIKGLQKEARQ